MDKEDLGDYIRKKEQEHPGFWTAETELDQVDELETLLEREPTPYERLFGIGLHWDPTVRAYVKPQDWGRGHSWTHSTTQVKKYELTNNCKAGPTGQTLRQIRALTDIPTMLVKAGDLGGWIEKEQNLSQSGTAWVSRNAQVYGDAHVFGDAHVTDDAKVFDTSWVHGNALITNNAWIMGKSIVNGNDVITAGSWRDYRTFGSNTPIVSSGVAVPDKEVKPILTDPPNLHCWHNWKKYVGFTDEFEYCTKCDVKRGEE